MFRLVDRKSNVHLRKQKHNVSNYSTVTQQDHKPNALLSRRHLNPGKIITSGVGRIMKSLAYESYLYNNVTEPTLFIRRTVPTVVIGANQNPWIECDINKMDKNHVELVRRPTGGGAVYVDEGNLLVSFIGNIKNFPKLSKEYCNRVLTESIRETFSVNAVASGRNDIMVDNKKVAGAAFKYEMNQEKYVHHLSILVSCDLNVLPNYLTPDKRKLESKGISSVKSRVANLSTYNPNKGVIDLQNSIVDNFAKLHSEINFDHITISESDMSRIPEVLRQYDNMNSVNYIYGATPMFSHKIDERYPWGTIYLFLQIENGIITSITTHTDSLFVGLPQLLREILTGIKYLPNDIKNAIEHTTVLEDANRDTYDIRIILDDIMNLLLREVNTAKLHY